MNCNLILCLQAEEYINISFIFVQYIYGWDYQDISLCLEHCFGVIKLIFVLYVNIQEWVPGLFYRL